MSPAVRHARPAGDKPAGQPSWPGRLALAAVFALVAALALRQVASLDIGFHLKAGNRILAGGGWPANDCFTYTVTDHRYIDTSWGYQVLVALVERVGGAPGLVLFHCALVLVTFGLVVATVRLVPADPLGLAVLLLLAGLAAELRFEARPELVSYALLALVLHLLHRHAEGRSAPLWLLPLVFLLWANGHSLFILGWAALACFIGGLALRERRLDHALTGWSAAAVAVGLLNPYGWRGVVFPFTLASRLAERNVFAQEIGEFRSPFAVLEPSEQFPFRPWVPVAAFFLLFLLVLASSPKLFRQRRYVCLLLALPFLYLSSRMMRNMPLAGVACLPGAAWGLPLAGAGGLARPVRRVVLGGLLLVVLVLGLGVYHDAYYVATRRLDRWGLGWNRLALPIDATEFAARHELPGRVLNQLNFGGWLMWARPEPVYIDGRLEVMGEQFFSDYREVFGDAARREAAVERWDIGWIIFPYATSPALLQELSRDGRWTLAYFDHLAAIFVRTERMTLPPTGDPAPALDLAALPGLAAPRRGGLERGLAGLVGRERFPAEAFNRGLFHYFRGEPERAAALFAAGIRESRGAYYELYANLGAALYRLGRWSEARGCYTVVLAEVPTNRTARERLRDIDVRTGGSVRRP